MGSCQRDHWIGQARIYDDGRVDEPRLLPLAGRIAGDPDVADRTIYFGPQFAAGRWWTGMLRIMFWGHDRDRVLAATRQRFTAELRGTS
jgi:hypothetical protein